MVSWAEGSRSAVRTAVWEHGAGSTLCPERMRRGYMASSSLCVDDLTAELPADCRLVSDHDLFENRGRH